MFALALIALALSTVPFVMLCVGDPNRRRVENAKLEDGDEVQIGKYRMIFLT